MPSHWIPRLIAITCGLWAPLAPLDSALAKGESWYLSTNQIALQATNRYFASISVINDSAEPVYIKSAIERISLKEGERIRSPDTEQSLTISPDEFVLPPKSSVVVRVFSKPGMEINSSNQSYYVKLEDVSRTETLREGSNTGFVLAYEFLVSVAPRIDPVPQSKDFQITQVSDAHYIFKNKSNRHIYLDDGFACADNSQPLVECQKIEKSPKQSLLPQESVPFEAMPGLKFFGFLAYDNINLSSGQRAHIQPVSHE